MSLSFDAIKRKQTVSVIINSIAFFTALFALTFGVFILVSKLTDTDINLLLSISVSLAVGTAAGGLATLLNFKSSSAIAREIDNTNSLDERIQTMLEYSDDLSAIAQLQRMDAEERLMKAYSEKPLLKKFGMSITALVLAAAVLLPAILIPKAQDPGNTTPTTPEYVEPFELESWQYNRLMDLIEKVKAANIDEAFKSATVTELERLVNALKTTDTRNGMLSEVITSIVLVDAAAEITQTYKLIAVALFESDPLIDSETGEAIDDMTYMKVKALAQLILTQNAIYFGQEIKSVRGYFESDSTIGEITVPDGEEAEPTPASTRVITITQKLTSLKSAIEGALNDTAIPEGDLIKAHLLTFAAKIGECIGEENENTRQSLIDKAFDEMSDNVSTVLAAQYENKAIRDNVIDTLILLFDIDRKTLPKLLGDIIPQLIDEENSSGSNNENSSVSGGYGDGNELYGSNDTIYDPFGEDGAGHKLYGDVFDDYYRKISELLSDESLSEETRQAMAEYFQKLSDGTKKN